jgi:hypothetical protein
MTARRLGMAIAKATVLVLLLGLPLTLTQTPPAAAGWDEGVAAYERGDYATALEEFRALAEAGDSDGQVGLGILYFGGYGVARDFTQAARWFRRAAEQGNPYGQFELGDLYYRGLGVPEDVAQAAQWFERAARQGHLAAQQNLAVLYAVGDGVPFDPVRAYAWFAAAAAGASAEAASGAEVVAQAMSEAEIAEAVALAQEVIDRQNKGTAIWDQPALDLAAPLGAQGNPLRADGPPGEHAYLALLRCPDGEAPSYERLGSVGEGPYGGILDLYELYCGPGEPVRIYMDMYHPEHYETRPVPGFTLAPGD